MKHFKSIFLLALLIGLVTSATRAQSTDQSSPTPITSSELVITGPRKNNQQYYYSFTGGPGEVTITLSVKAKSSSTFVGIKVFDGESNTLTYHNMSADTSLGMALKKFDVGEKQTLLLSFNSDPSLAECKIKFGGAVEFGTSEATLSSGPQAVLSETTPTMSSSQPTSDLSAVNQTSITNSGSGGKNKAFAFSILDAVGQRFNIPANGKLHLEMKDGSVQEIDLAQVKKILVKQ